VVAVVAALSDGLILLSAPVAFGPGLTRVVTITRGLTDGLVSALLLMFGLGLARVVALAATLTDGLPLAPVCLAGGSTVVAHSFAAFGTRRRRRGTLGSTACAALRHSIAT
jgi:hypothetical protein